MESKTCKKCNISKPISAFPPHKGNKDGLLGDCKECKNKYHREYNKKLKEKVVGKLIKYFTYKLESIKRQDAKRFPEHEFNLTVEDLKEVYDVYGGLCVYSNKKLKGGSKASIYNKISFDRIDNDKPHTKENLQLTSQFMNMTRGDRTHKEFLEWIANSV